MRKLLIVGAALCAASVAHAQKPPPMPDTVLVDSTQLAGLIAALDRAHYPDLPYKEVEGIANLVNAVKTCTMMQVPQNGTTMMNGNSPCKAVMAAQQEQQQALTKAATDARAAQKAEDEKANNEALAKAVADAKDAQKQEDVGAIAAAEAKAKAAEDAAMAASKGKQPAQ